MATEKREIEIALRSRSAEASADRLNTKVKTVGRTADGAESSMLRLTRVASAIGAALATSRIIQYADAWTNVNNRLRAATLNSLEFTKAQQGVIAIAQQAGVDIAGVADGYSRIAQNTAELGISQERLLDVTRKVTLAIKAGGATAQEASSVIVQLGQGLGAGALQGDELRSIMEASIPITKALAKEFRVTTGELKKLGSEGKITADRVISAIENMDESALEFTKDISSGFTELNNAITVFVGNLDESFAASENIAGVLSGLAQNIDIVAESLSLFIKIGATIYITNLSKAVIANTASFAANQAQLIRYNATLAAGAGVSRTAASATWALTYAMRALKAALPFGIVLLGIEILQNLVTATNDQIAANDRYAESTRKLNARLETRAEKERAIALRTSAEVSVRDQDKLNAQLEKIEDQKLRILKSNAAEEAKIKGEQYNEEERLTLFQITQVQNRIKVMEEEAARLQAIANKSQAAFQKIQGSIGGETSEDKILSGVFENRSSAVGEREKRQTNRDLDAFFNQENVFSGKRDLSKESQKGAGADFISRLKLETQQLQAELEVRKQLNAGYITEQQANDALELQNILFNYEAKRQTILEQEFQTETLRQEALNELREQEIATVQSYQERLTAATREGTEERNKLSLLEQNARIDNIRTGASSALSLLSAFGDQSFKTQKKFAIAEAIVNIASGVAKALNNPYPANLAFAAQVAAQGAGLLATIKSSNPSSSSAAASAPASAPATTAATPSIENQSQSRTINITGLDGFDDDQPIPLTVGGLKSLLSSNEDVNIAINQGQQNAQRVGAI